MNFLASSTEMYNHVDARIQMSRFSLDSCVYSVEPPKVSAGSQQVYEEFVRRGAKGAREPSVKTRQLYQQYTCKHYL